MKILIVYHSLTLTADRWPWLSVLRQLISEVIAQ